jgi:hypothetical protein
MIRELQLPRASAWWWARALHRATGFFLGSRATGERPPGPSNCIPKRSGWVGNICPTTNRNTLLPSGCWAVRYPRSSKSEALFHRAKLA